MRTVLRIVVVAVKGLRQLISLLLIALALTFLVLLMLQFRHPEKWDTLRAVGLLKLWGDPILAGIGSWVGVQWPVKSGPARFLPLAIAVLVLFARSSLMDHSARAVRWVERRIPMPRARPKKPAKAPAVPAEVPPPAAAEGAAQPGAAAAPPSVAPPPPVPTAAQAAPTPPTPERAAPPAPAAPGEPSPSAVPAEPTLVVEADEDLLEGATLAAPPPAPVSGTGPAASGRGRQVPAKIARYEVLAELGHGAMGVVYKARDPQIGRLVAIKSILSANLADSDLDSYKQRFFSEAKAAGQMSHPGIVTVHDLTEDELGQPCLVMEFVEGRTLEGLVASERLSLGQSIDITIQVAEALDYAHSRGVIHRDIKPANILITPRGDAKVTDFGIAKLEGVQLTQTGQLIGTPAFMSPEQFTGAVADSRVDIFSLGSVLYWLLTGEKPFPGETITAIAFKVVQMSPMPARQLNPALPPEIDDILGRCLAKDPEQRYLTAHLLAADLQAFKKGRPVGFLRADALPPQD